MLQRSRLAVVILLLTAARLVAAPAATGPATEHRWYQVLLEGRPAGWMHSAETRDAAGRIETASEMSVTVRRGPVEVAISMQSAFVETADGQPIRATQTQKLGTMEVVQEMTFKPEGIEMVARQGQSEQKRFVPQEGERKWLPPAAAERYVAEKMAAGEKDIRVSVIDPASGPQPVETRLTRRGEEVIEVTGKSVPATVWDRTVSLMPGVVMKEYLGERGESLKSSVSLMPGMTMTIVAADEALAKAQIDPPELIASTLVQPDRAIARPRELGRAVYELTIARIDPGAGGGEPAADAGAATGSQRVEAVVGREGVTRVTVDPEAVRAAGAPVDAAPREEHLAATSMLNHEDPKVRELVKQALGDGKPTAAETAERLRRFVHGHVRAKDLSVGFATASEVARTRQGDCTEHAVLLAALLRGAGVPSRVVSGLVYADEFLGRRGVFGYHMWAEAWVAAGDHQGYWLPLDATLPGEKFDATHIALTTSVMADAGMVNDMVRMVPVIGRLSIRVLEPAERKAE